MTLIFKIYGKIDGVNDVVHHALSGNIWYGWLLIALEVASIGYYLWHYRHDVAFRFWHLWTFIIISFLLILTDEEWDILFPYECWYSFANITIGISIAGFVGTIATYIINKKEDGKEVYYTKIDNRRKDYA